MLRDAPDMLGIKLTLRVNSKIADLLLGEENHLITSLEQTLGKRIVIYPNPQFHMEEFDIFEVFKE